MTKCLHFKGNKKIKKKKRKGRLLKDLYASGLNRVSTCARGIQSHPPPLPNKHLLRRDKETILLVQAKLAGFADASTNR